MKTFVKLALILFSLVFILKTQWIYWPVILIGALIVYFGYAYADSDELSRQNIKSWLKEVPRAWERLFI